MSERTYFFLAGWTKFSVETNYFSMEKVVHFRTPELFNGLFTYLAVMISIRNLIKICSTDHHPYTHLRLRVHDFSELTGTSVSWA